MLQHAKVAQDCCTSSPSPVVKSAVTRLSTLDRFRNVTSPRNTRIVSELQTFNSSPLHKKKGCFKTTKYEMRCIQISADCWYVRTRHDALTRQIKTKHSLLSSAYFPLHHHTNDLSLTAKSQIRTVLFIY